MAVQPDQHHSGLARWAWGLLIGSGTWLLLFLLQQGQEQPVAQYLDQLENKSLDLRIRWREQYAPTVADDSIVILTVDQHGIELLENSRLLVESRTGQPAPDTFDTVWPWPRSYFGTVAMYLRAQGARAVFFDFLYTGASPQDVENFEPDTSTFAELCKQSGIAHHAVFFDPISADQPSSEVAQEDPVLKVHHEIVAARLALLGAEGLDKAAIPVPFGHGLLTNSVQVPIPSLVDSAVSLGAVNATVDSDGVIRRVALLHDFRGKTYGFAQLSVARTLLDTKRFEMDPKAGTLLLDDLAIPVDDQAQLLINWHGPEGTYETRGLHGVMIDAEGVSFGDEPIIPTEVFRDKVVLLGASAVGLQDIKATPLDQTMPGVEVHATVLDNILNDDFLRRTKGLERHGLSLLLFLLGGQLLVRRQSAWASLGIFLALLTLTIGGCSWALLSQTLWLDMVVPVIGLVLLFAAAQTVQYFTEGKQKRQIRNVFQRYLPSTVVDEVLKIPIEELKLGGERKELTVSFSDIEGFTGISESLGPEELVSMLNVYLSEMSDIVGRHGGTLDKYIGDCIMAFWGAPLPTENGAVQACMAALESQERLAVLRERFLQEGLPALHARIGINTGDVLVGNMGSDSHFSYTVMGDEVNLASRLEGANKQYGSYLLLGENTYERAKQSIEARLLDLVRVKGRSTPVRVYELMARKGELSSEQEELRSRYLEGLELYNQANWQGALERFEAGLALVPSDGPCKTYSARCRHFCDNPPPAPWDGVYTMTSK